MKFTIEDNPEAIRRYGHIRPATWGAARCVAGYPDGKHRCTLERGHRGPHVSHGRFRKVLAVWDAGVQVQPAGGKVKAEARPPSRIRPWDGGFVAALAAFSRRLIKKAPPMEATLFLIFFLGMVVFVLDWTLRLLGLR